MSEIKVNSIKGVGASAAAITVNNTDGTCTANITNNLSNRNLIINGAMQVAQRGTSDSGITGSQYADGPDRYKLGGSSFGTVTVSQSTDSPDGFSNSYKVDVTTANGSLSAGSLLEIQQSLEGQNVQAFAKGTSAAKQYALSFYVKSTKTGTYVAMLLDHDNNRMVCKTYTVSDTNWNRYTLIFPADTTGAFDNNNEKSLSVKFALVAGTSFTSGTLQTTWGTSANATSRVGQVNFADSTSNEWYLTGLQLEVGSVATDFEHRSFAQELALCQRYCYKHEIQGSNGPYALQYETGHKIAQDFFPVPMRTTPSYTITYNTGSPIPYNVSQNMFKAYIASSYSSGSPIYMESAIYFAEL